MSSTVRGKTFGGISGNGLMTPLYVLIDQSGHVRYAGHGGSDLAEVRARIEELDAALTARMISSAFSTCDEITYKLG
jgi:hypothetical protein